jgi:hypothetical protein
MTTDQIVDEIRATRAALLQGGRQLQGERPSRRRAKRPGRPRRRGDWPASFLTLGMGTPHARAGGRGSFPVPG